MKIKIILIIIAILVVVGIVWYGVNKRTIGEIKIGVITALTGPGAEYGTATQKGLDLAVQKINNEGGINGRLMRLIYEDDKCDSQTSLVALQKLTGVDKTNIIIGSVCSSVVLTMAPVVQEKNLLLISSGASNPKISQYPNVFRTWPSDALQGEFLAKFIAETMKLKRVGIIFLNNDYGVGLRDAFQKDFQQKGGNMVAAEAMAIDESDARTQLGKIKSANPEGVFLATYARQMGIILKQAKELGFSAQFFGGEGTQDPSVIEIGKEGAEGLIGTVPATANSQTRDKFLADFQKTYNEEPGITADSAYDIPFILKEVMQKCNNYSDIDCLKDNLLQIKDFSGASGIINFDANGDLVGKTYNLITIKNGQFVPYEH